MDASGARERILIGFLCGLRYKARANSGSTNENANLSGRIGRGCPARDVQPDSARVEDAARLASVHEEIARMPMGYSTHSEAEQERDDAREPGA
ncbi:hypothetical protein [Variovorax sp. PBS-H4]|uniref:hypothetical protein n=1 Tax=Variovorax sp. PBS-H4 TaxID=434008 RepID=UPI0013A5783D|nr:hypothetical protein [Variovorax sp. PBS-H4]